ncbi:hypothetical protein KEM48_005480 [Puccinia striiformis f. sp. tritici PST-130]|nr:hypothetical protein KEM48_005480 [Puccinia striiformis f. sp. tritici PST-130]
MSQTFTPTAKFSSNERDWQAEIGGGSSQIASLLGGDRQSDAMNWVPPPIAQQSSINPVEAPSAPTAEQTPAPAPEEEELPRVMMPDGSRFIPSRKVREPVGGHSSMADLLSGGR